MSSRAPSVRARVDVSSTAMVPARLLASRVFPEREAEALLRDVAAPNRDKLLEAVRAESTERFFEALAAVLRAIDWSKDPSVLDAHCRLVGFGCLDHLRIGNLLDLVRRAAEPDADVALDVVAAIELDDRAAASRVRERVARKELPPGLAPARGVLPLPDDPLGGLRAARLLRPLLEGSDEARLRTAVDVAVGAGNYAVHLVSAIAEARALELPEVVAELPDHRRLAARLMLWLAATIDRSFGEELLVRIVEGDYWDAHDLETYDVAWDRSLDRVDGDRLTVARRFGCTVLTGLARFDAYVGSPPHKPRRWRLSARRFADAQRAERALDGHRAGATPIYRQKDLDQRLLAEVGRRERVAELLGVGASPDARAADPDLRGQTALHRAAGATDCGDVVRRLLSAGADPTALFREKNAIELLSAREPSAVVAADLLAAAGLRSRDPGNLFAAAELGNHRLIAALLRAGADPSVTRDGKTPAQVALERGHARTAAVLGHRP